MNQETILGGVSGHEILPPADSEHKRTFFSPREIHRQVEASDYFSKCFSIEVCSHAIVVYCDAIGRWHTAPYISNSYLRASQPLLKHSSKKDLSLEFVFN